jgi:hypothetical protein
VEDRPGAVTGMEDSESFFAAIVSPGADPGLMGVGGESI